MPKTYGPEPQYDGEDVLFGLGNDASLIWDYQPRLMSMSMDRTEPISWQEGRATGRTKAGTLNFKVYKVIMNI